MPLVFHVDQFIVENRFNFFHILIVFLTNRLLMFFALSFENTHVKRFWGQAWQWRLLRGGRLIIMPGT
jgi:hypothetical protein